MAQRIMSRIKGDRINIAIPDEYVDEGYLVLDMFRAKLLRKIINAWLKKQKQHVKK